MRSTSPIKPTAAPPRTRGTVPLEFHFEPAGFAEIGADSNGFAFDNERPRHREWLEAHMLANRLSTNGEYREFIRSGGYSTPHLWLADGWTAVRSRGWNRPLCWSADLEREYTLGGWRPLDEHAPVCHVSLYEAAAFAAWAGARLPTEAEWESRAETMTPARGNLRETGWLHPAAATALPAARGAESPPDLGRRLGMVCVGLSTLPSISPAGRLARRVQRQVHVEPVGRARRFVRDARGPCARNLSQLLLSARPLAIPRHSSREGRLAARSAGTGAFIAPRPHLLRAQECAMLQSARAVADSAAASLAANRQHILAGLTAPQKHLAPKYLYDERGSQLFDEICSLPEYYPTRTEVGLLRTYATAIAAFTGPRADVLELGAGSSLKARLLLGCLDRPASYVPVDISAAYLAQQAAEVAATFPRVTVLPVLADFTRPFALPETLTHGTDARVLPGLDDRQPLARSRGGAALHVGRAHARRRTLARCRHLQGRGRAARRL